MSDIVQRLMDYDKHGVTAADRVQLREDAAMEIFTLRNTLKDARLQIEYLHGKFQPTGSGAAVLARIDAALTHDKSPLRPELVIARAWLTKLIEGLDLDPDTTVMNIKVHGPKPTRTVAKTTLTESLDRIDAALSSSK